MLCHPMTPRFPSAFLFLPCAVSPEAHTYPGRQREHRGGRSTGLLEGGGKSLDRGTSSGSAASSLGDLGQGISLSEAQRLHLGTGPQALRTAWLLPRTCQALVLLWVPHNHWADDVSKVQGGRGARPRSLAGRWGRGVSREQARGPAGAREPSPSQRLPGAGSRDGLRQPP